MNMLSPQVPAGSENGVFALLNILADPTAAKAMLDKIIAAKADADVRAAEVEKREKAVAETEIGLAKIEANLDTRKAKLDEYAYTFTNKAQAFYPEKVNF